MKFIALSVFIFLTWFTTFSQSLEKIYLDSNYHETKSSKAKYYKIINKDSIDNKIWKTKTYYLSDKLYSINYSFDKKGTRRYGKFIAFYENGANFMSGEYCENEKSEYCGIFKSYYKNGVLYSQTPYINNKVCGEVLQYFSTGVLARKVNICNNSMSGTYFSYHENGKVDRQIEYSNDGKILSEKYFDPDGIEGKYTPPEFIGGDRAAILFTNSNLKYPDFALKKNISGKVIVEFDICEDGKVCNATIIESPDSSLSEEALRVTLLMPNWKPAERDGKKIKTRFQNPINFSIQ